MADRVVLLAMLYVFAAKIASHTFSALTFLAPARQCVFVGKTNDLASRGSGHGGPSRFLSKMVTVFTVHRHS